MRIVCRARVSVSVYVCVCVWLFLRCWVLFFLMLLAVVSLMNSWAQIVHLDDYMFMFAWPTAVITSLSLIVIGSVDAQQAVLKVHLHELFAFIPWRPPKATSSFQQR